MSYVITSLLFTTTVLHPTIGPKPNSLYMYLFFMRFSSAVPH